MPVAATQKMIVCPYPFCNSRVWFGRRFLTRAAVIVAEGERVRMEGRVRRFSRACAPLRPGMCAGSGLPRRGANVVRKRWVTNPGDPAGAAGAVSGGPADGEGSAPLAGGSAAGDRSDAGGGRG